MAFARKVWKLLVAIKDGLALLFLLLFFLLLYAALTARPSLGSVQPGALLLKLDGAIVEEPANEDPLRVLLSGEAPLRQYGVHDIVRGLRAAAADDRIKAVVLDLSRFTGGGQVHMSDIGEALDGVRARGKPVLTFAQLYGDDGIQLAAHASEVWVDPLGGAFPTGPGGNMLYFGPFLDRLKVTPHVYRAGIYKSAVEPFTSGEMSPEARENLQQIYTARWQAWQAEVARGRPKANIALATRDPAAWLRASGGDGARAAVAAGLVDRIGDATQFGSRVAELAGRSRTTKRPGSYAHTSLDTWLAANKRARAGRAIGVVTIAGTITADKAGPGAAGGERIARLLDDALDDNLAALVVRVDSPGGAVTGGEQIRAAIARHKARGIPVVVSMANLAASGGYWVTTPADRIFAEPATVTGSIGVFAVLPSFERALTGLGVRSDGLRTTPLSGQPDPFAGYSPEFDAMLQSSVDFNYSRFLNLVASARRKTVQQVDAVAQGRVWDGGSARQVGLVDQFGGLDDALAYAAARARLAKGGWHPVFLGAERPGYLTLLQALRGGDDDAETAAVRDWAGLATQRRNSGMARILGELERIGGTVGVQAYCLGCPSGQVQPPARSPDVATLTLLARLAGIRTE